MTHSSSAVLLQQLEDAHTALRELKQRNAGLEKDLRESQKREGAIKAVFFHEFEKERDLEPRRRSLEEKKTKLLEMREKFQRRWRSLEKRKIQFREEVAAREDINNHPPAPGDRGLHNADGVKLQSQSITLTSGDLSEIFTANPNRNFWDLPEIDMNDSKVLLLRRHDYYTGWYDAMRSIDRTKATSNYRSDPRLRLKVHVTDVMDGPFHPSKDGRQPYNAGLNAGLVFTWSALCKAYNMPERDVRLDGRVWELRDLEAVMRDDVMGEYAFWEGMSSGRARVEILFKLKVDSGIWMTRLDPPQVEFLQGGGKKRRVLRKPKAEPEAESE